MKSQIASNLQNQLPPTQTNQDKQPRTRRLRAKNKSGTVTYIVQTANDRPRQANTANQNEQQKQSSSTNNQQHLPASSQLTQEQLNIQIRIEQEKVVALLENISQTAKELDYRVLDELNSDDNSVESYCLKSFLNSVEMLAHHWQMIKKERYQYRVANHGHLDIYINEMPRATQEGKIFNIKTFVLSCKTPYMKTKDGSKVYISKEYSNAAGRLHLSFYTLHDLIVRDLNTKLEFISKQNSSRGSIMAFFKTIFSSGSEGSQFHPLFKETVLLRKIKKQVKIFELCIRNFEETYISMIQDLQQKTFKLNVDSDNNQYNESSIVMQKRQNNKISKDLGKIKILENQLFDADGNILTSMKNSFTQSMNQPSCNSRFNENSQYIMAGNFHGNGPVANITPMLNLRKIAHDDNSIKPTCSSVGPTSRLKQTISPTNNNQGKNTTRTNVSSSSRNSGFRPLNSLQNTDGQGIFQRKHEFIGSLISTSSQPLMMNQALQNIQKKTISPQIIKHNYMPLQNSVGNMNSGMVQNSNTSNDELVVKYIDLLDDKENNHGNSNLAKSSTINNNFAFQTPNPYSNLVNSAKNKMMQTHTTGFSNTPGGGQNNISTFANTIIQQRNSNANEFPMSNTNTNLMKSKASQNDENDPHFMNTQQHMKLLSSSGAATPLINTMSNNNNLLVESKAQYKNMMMDTNKRVIKTSRNLFNEQCNSNTNQGFNSNGSGMLMQGNYQMMQQQHEIENLQQPVLQPHYQSKGDSGNYVMSMPSLQQQQQSYNQAINNLQQFNHNSHNNSISGLQKMMPLTGSRTNLDILNKQQHLNNMNNSFDNSSSSSNNNEDDEDEMSNEEEDENDDRHQINQSSLMRASRIEQRLEQINPNDLMLYNHLCEQFNS